MRVPVFSPTLPVFAFSRLKTLLWVFLTLLSASVWGSSFPNQPIYQGTLQDSVGSPLRGYYDLELRFYSTAQGTQPLAVVSFDSVEVVDGKFTLDLGNGSAEPDLPWTDPGESTQLFLSITVDGKLQTPLLNVSTDGQTVFVLPDDGDGTPLLDAVSPSAVPTVVGAPFVGSGGAESTEGQVATTTGGNQEPPESVTLAEFTLANGNTVEFVAVPELGDVGVIETAEIDGYGSTIAAYQGMSALEIFRRVAPEGTPIPPLLLDLEAARCQDSGEDSGLENDPVVPQEPAEDASWLAASSEGRMVLKSHCGGDGAQDFMDNYCDQSGFALKSPIHYCDHHYHPAGGNSLWYSLIRSSIKNGKYEKRWNSHGITGACSTSVQISHFFWGYTAGTGWQWKKNFSYTLDPGFVVTTLWYGGSKRYRRIERFRFGGVGGFRAASTFYNNL